MCSSNLWLGQSRLLLPMKYKDKLVDHIFLVLYIGSDLLMHASSQLKIEHCGFRRRNPSIHSTSGYQLVQCQSLLHWRFLALLWTVNSWTLDLMSLISRRIPDPFPTDFSDACTAVVLEVIGKLNYFSSILI